jgi:hypothetical protein
VYLVYSTPDYRSDVITLGKGLAADFPLSGLGMSAVLHNIFTDAYIVQAIVWPSRQTHRSTPQQLRNLCSDSPQTLVSYTTALHQTTAIRSRARRYRLQARIRPVALSPRQMV